MCDELHAQKPAHVATGGRKLSSPPKNHPQIMQKICFSQTTRSQNHQIPRPQKSQKQSSRLRSYTLRVQGSAQKPKSRRNNTLCCSHRALFLKRGRGAQVALMSAALQVVRIDDVPAQQHET